MGFKKGQKPTHGFKKGYTPWNKGGTSWNKGVSQGESSKEKNRLSHLGKKRKPRSNEWKKNISLSKLGKKCYNWKGGITKLSIKIRKCFEYKLWRSDVFERDKFTCQECKISGVYLNADHIKPFSVIMFENKIKNFEQALKCEELWDINNGRTLCVDCHRKTDTWGNRLYQQLRSEL